MDPPDLSANLMPQAWQAYQIGDLTRAEDLCREAQRNQIYLAEALDLMGSIAHRCGQLDVAIARLRQAVEADPANADYQNNLGVFLTNAGNWVEAVQCYHQALRLRRDFADAYNNLGFALCRLGEFKQAKSACEEALRLRPVFPEANNHLGLAFMELGKLDEAAEHFRRALRLRADFVEARHNLGNVLEEQGHFSQAAACFEEVSRLHPGLAEPHVGLADVFKRLGRFPAAVAHLQRAAQIDPACALAYCNLSYFAIHGLYDFAEAELGKVRKLVSDTRLSLLDRSLMNLTLGNVHDHLGDYQAAFSCYQEGNRLRRQWFQETGRAFDSGVHRAIVDRIINSFDEAFFRQVQPGLTDSELPVFVVGMPRSGTTLVEQILSSHTDVVGAGELRDIAQLMDEFGTGNEPDSGFPASVQNAPAEDLRKTACRYLDRLVQIAGPSAVRVVDKMPDNYLYLGIIARLFPRARVIHCRRDPLDVCLSCYLENFKSVRYSWSLEDLGNYHQDYQRLMAHWRRVLPLKVLDVRYEGLVAHQEQVTRNLIAFCGLDWQDGCLEFFKNARPVQTASAVQVRRPVYATSIGRWRKYAAQLGPLQRALGLDSSPDLASPASWEAES